MAPQLVIPLMVVSLVATAASTYMGYQSAKAAGKAERDMAEYNAEIARQEAERANEQARDLERQASEQATDAMSMAQQQREKIRRYQSSQRVAYAASGALTTEGTPLMVEIDSLTQQTLVAEADRKAAFAQVEATKYGAANARNTALLNYQQSALDKFKGEVAMKTAKNRANATLVQGIGSMAMQGAAIGSAMQTGRAPTTLSSSAANNKY